MEMNDPQVWTLIGVFTAIMLGGMTLMTTMMSRVIRAEVGGLRGEMVGEIGGLRGEIGGLRGEMVSEIGGLRGEMNARFDTVEHKIETLDKEVATLATRFWGSP
ncbi:hypothetical protein [Microbacterium sp. A84]|uniref:hypothetical protein n=1 Tax=Microbacterium sp. A84 TaxID=3450715 RepID=UPI003F4251EC